MAMGRLVHRPIIAMDMSSPIHGREVDLTMSSMTKSLPPSINNDMHDMSDDPLASSWPTDGLPVMEHLDDVGHVHMDRDRWSMVDKPWMSP